MAEPQDSAEPRSIIEALSSLNAKEWMNVMKDEMESMRTNQVQDFVDLPVGCKPLGTNEFSRSSEKQMDLLRCIRHASWQNNTPSKRTYGEKRERLRENFLPVVRFSSIRMILALVTRMDLELL